MSLNGIGALYLFLLAGVAGYSLIRRVPTVLHTPLLAGSNFLHGIVLVGALLALATARGQLQIIVGFIGVMAATANVVGGFIVSDRLLSLFEDKARAYENERHAERHAVEKLEGKGKRQRRQGASSEDMEQSS